MAHTQVQKSGVSLQTHKQSPFWFPPDELQFSYKKALDANLKQQRKEEATLPLDKHLTFRGKFSADLRNVLNVTEYSQLRLPCSKSEETIERTRKKAVPMRHYIEDMRNAFRNRLTAGYIYDDVLLREEQFRRDQLLLAAVYRRQTIFKELFERFLEEDHADTMAMMDRTEEAQRMYAQMESRQRKLADDLGILQRQVYILEEIWANYKVYQNFLYQVSPSWWRKEREPIRLFTHKEDESDDRDSVEFDTRTSDIVAIIDRGTSKNEKKELYFTDPSQLLAVFEAMEIQSLNSLLHSEELSSPLDTMSQVLSKIKVEYEREEAQILDMLSDLESNIVWEEKRSENLERDARQLLNGKFKDLLGHEDIIMLYVCVEDAYESCIGANDDKLGMHLMMKVLEVRYSMQLLELESLPAVVVDPIEKMYYWEDARRMRRARWALQETQRIARREEGLSHALRPPPPRPSQPPKAHRSAVSRLVRKARPKPPSLTQEQIDFLTFFTDFCQHTDSPAKVLEEIQKTNVPK